MVTPEYADDDRPFDWDESLSRIDDRVWSYLVFRAPFTWQLFLNWWIARRYVMPRDVRRR